MIFKSLSLFNSLEIAERLGNAPRHAPSKPESLESASRRRRIGRLPPGIRSGRVIAAILSSIGVVFGLSTTATAAVVSACTGVSLPPSVVTGLLAPIFTQLSPILNLPPLNLGNTLTSINSGAPITLQVLDTSGNVVTNTAPCDTTAHTYQLDTPAGIAFGGNMITGLGNGTTASAADINAIAIGNGAATSNTALKAIALGYLSSSTGVGAVAFGANTVATNAGDIALGSGSTTATTVATTGTTLNGTAYTFAGTTPTSTLSIGSVGNERTITNVAAGRLSASSTDAVNGSQLFATNTAINNITNIGTGVKYFHANSLLADSVATGTDSVAVGPAASASATNSMALGNGASATGANSVALGSNSVAVLGVQTGYTGYGLSTAQNAIGEVSVGATGSTRKITNVAAGSNATDAVNVSQFNQVGQNTATSLGGGASYNSTTGAYTGPSYVIGGTTYNDVGSALGAQNTIVQNAGTSIANVFGSTFVYNPATGGYTGSFTYNAGSYSSIQAAFDAINNSVNNLPANKYFNVNSVLANSIASGMDSTSIGPQALSSGNRSIAAGVGSQALSASSVAIGDTAVAQGGKAVSIGAGNTATGNGAVAIGNLSTATGIGSVALGNASNANGAGSLALGNTAVAVAANGVALGSGSIASNAGDVALGSNSLSSATTASTGATIAGTAYTFAGGTPASAVSVGSVGNERQVENVAAGVLSANSTNAVNGSQLFATNTAVNTIATTITNIYNTGVRYFHTNSTLANSTPGGANSVAIGPAASTAVTATNAVAIGNGSSAGASGSLALGAGATTSIANNVALGTNAVAGAADGGWAGTTIGGLNIATNTLNANAVVGISGNGINRQIQGVADGAVSATSTDAVNGSQLFYTVQALTTAISAPVAADNVNNFAGPTAVAGRNGLAVGYGAATSGVNSVALGNGSSDGGRANVVSVGTAGATRQVVNVGAGTQATDAVNVSQLQSLVTALGGGTTINITTGAVTGPTYNVGGNTYTDVGSALTATNKLAVQYTADVNGNPTNQVTLTGANNGQAVRISNVANGVNNNDAVNLGQLKAVSSTIDQITNNLNSLSGQVASNQTEARRGIATSAAMANLPFSATPGKWSPAVAYGGFKGQTPSQWASSILPTTTSASSCGLRPAMCRLPAT